MAEAEELPSSSVFNNIFELIASDEVKKLGMVCALPPKPLLVRQVTAGGWAELNGVQLGDKLLEVNGSPAPEMSAEDLKRAMASRPLSFRFMRLSQVEPMVPAPISQESSTNDEPASLQETLEDSNQEENCELETEVVDKSDKVEGVAKQDAALRIQRVFRGRCVRKLLVATTFESKPTFKNLTDFCDAWKSRNTPDEAAVKIQSLLRGCRIRKSLRQGCDSASNDKDQVSKVGISTVCEASETRHTPEAEAAITIQRIARGRSVRKSLLAQSRGSEFSNSLQQDPIGESSTHSETSPGLQNICSDEQMKDRSMEKAAIEIQRRYRGSFVRKHVRQTSNLEVSHAATQNGVEHLADAVRQELHDDPVCHDDRYDDSDSTSARNYDEEPGSCYDGTEEDEWSSQLDRERLGVVHSTNPSLDDLRNERSVRGRPGFSLEQEEDPQRSVLEESARGAVSKQCSHSQENSVRRGMPFQRNLHEFSEEEEEDELEYDDVSAQPSQFGMSSWADGSGDTSALDMFKSELLRKEHGCVRAWRNAIDLSGSGRVIFKDFCEACRRLGFRGSIRDVWRQLDDVGSGGISLQDLDPDAAHALGRFHSALVARYGGLRVATKALGLTGARKLNEREFCSLLRAHGIMPKFEASTLFRMLCLCPVASSLDRKAGISVRDFEWLQDVSKYLPVVMPDRIQPGMGDDSCSARSRQSSWFYDMSESLSDSEEDMESNCGNMVFDKLYQDAMDLKERRMEQSCGQVMETESRGPVDPHRFERLHNEWRTKREEQERLAEAHFRQQCPQDGPRHLSQEVWERLNQPKQSVSHEGCFRPDLLDNYSSAQLRSACEQEGFSCKGKSREELIELLKLLKQPELPKTTAPKMTQRTEELYMDHKRRLAGQEEKRLKAEHDKEMEIQAMQMKPSSTPSRGVHRRLHAEAEAAKQRKREEVERVAAEREASLQQPARPPANPMTFHRLYLDGLDRDAKVSEKKRQLEREAELKLKESSVHRNKTADPRVFNRLYHKVRRGFEAELDETGQSEPLDEMRSVNEREDSVKFDPVWQQKGAARPSRDELNQMLRNKMEKVETAQRTAVATKGGPPVDPVGPPGIIKRGPTATSTLNGDRDSTPARASAPKRQGQPSSHSDRRKEVAFRCRESLVEYSTGSSSVRAEYGDIMSSEIGMLRDFATFLFGCFPTVEVAADAFDLYKTDRLSVAAFLAGCKRLRFRGDAKTIFRAIDVDNVGFIGKREFQVLNRFHPHPSVELDAPEPFPLPTSAKGRKSLPDSPSKSGSNAKTIQNASASAQRMLHHSASEPERGEGQRRRGLGELQRCGPGESHVQPTSSRANAVSSAYPHKSRIKASSSTSLEGPEQPPQSRIPVPKAAQSQRQAASGHSRADEDLSAQLLEHSRYPYKGCISDVAEHWNRQPLAKTRTRMDSIPTTASPVNHQAQALREMVSSSSATGGNMKARREAATWAALEVAEFEAYSHGQLPTAAPHSRSDGGRINRPFDMGGKFVRHAIEAPLASDDQLLELDSLPSDEDDEDLVSPGAASSSGTPQFERPYHRSWATKRDDKASSASTGSSASNCSSPRSGDSESLPWQEGPRSSVASSASGAPWQETPAPTLKSTREKNAFARPTEKKGAVTDANHRHEETHDLKAEVLQLLQQYQADDVQDGPEAGLMHRRQSKESCGPELSSKSAWIHPDQPTALKT